MRLQFYNTSTSYVQSSKCTICKCVYMIMSFPIYLLSFVESDSVWSWKATRHNCKNSLHLETSRRLSDISKRHKPLTPDWKKQLRRLKGLTLKRMLLTGTGHSILYVANWLRPWTHISTCSRPSLASRTNTSEICSTDHVM